MKSGRNPHSLTIQRKREVRGVDYQDWTACERRREAEQFANHARRSITTEAPLITKFRKDTYVAADLSSTEAPDWFQFQKCLPRSSSGREGDPVPCLSVGSVCNDTPNIICLTAANALMPNAEPSRIPRFDPLHVFQWHLSIPGLGMCDGSICTQRPVDPTPEVCDFQTVFLSQESKHLKNLI